MKDYLLQVWNTIDPIYFKFTRLCYVTDHEQQNSIFRVRLTRYKGSAVLLNDGTTIQKNDLLLKIHLHNVKMLKELQPIKSDMKRAILIYHKIKNALPSLARFVQLHDHSEKIKGIIGITSLYRGANRLGFEVVPIKSKIYRLFKHYAFCFIHYFATNSKKDQPVYLFMSTNQLFTNYN